jgi:hypothetical protein
MKKKETFVRNDWLEHLLQVQATLWPLRSCRTICK